MHPILAAIFPVLALWSGNVVDVPPGDGPLLSGAAALLGLITYAVVALLLRRSWGARALATTSVILAASLIAWLPVEPRWQLVAFGVTCLLTMTVVDRLDAGAERRLNVFATVVLGAIVLANGVVVLTSRPSDPSTGPARAVDDQPRTEAEPMTGDQGRDVWIIVPDRYPNVAALQHLGLDGSPMVTALEARGFDVLTEATANYPQTLLSLASAWNFDLYDADGEAGPDVVGAAFAAIDHHLLGQEFKARGYEYVHVGPWTDITAAPAVADVTYTIRGQSELARSWVSKTVVGAALELRGLDFDHEGRQRRNTEYQLDAVRDLANEQAGQRLVMTHLIVPHEPYVFDVDGSAMPSGLDDVSAFDRQRQFVDAELLSLVDRLQARPEPPLIVIAADEGLYPRDWSNDVRATYDWSTITAEQGRDKLAILAAVYNPSPADREPFSLTNDMSLVNIMRWLANESLETDFDRLPDDHYLYRTTGWQELGLVDLDGATLD